MTNTSRSRPRRALWVLSMGLASAATLACGSDSPVDEDSVSITKGTYELRLELELTPQALGCTEPPTFAHVWFLQGDFPPGEPGASGWVAAIGIEYEGVRRDVPTTRSVPVLGAMDSSLVALAPFTVPLTDLAGSMHFASPGRALHSVSGIG